ncbi:MAG: NYN domain-containing protein [Bacteroidia bacterium]|nr:NYN domain-containing protein [Bacteroidia bacterium]
MIIPAHDALIDGFLSFISGFVMSIIEFTKIAVFYDGNFFSHVSNYYQFHHRRHSRISISGLHDFIRQEIARTDGTDARYCQIVDAHYFRGRLRTVDADQRDVLVKERTFDDVLLREGVTTHYLPLSPTGEKGIDVWMALEAYELALLKRYEVCVLVASDGDFLPLVRKLNSVGTRVMVLGWDFRYTSREGQERETKTAQILLREATYPVMMSERIEQGSMIGDPAIQALFIPVNEARRQNAAARLQHKLRFDVDASHVPGQDGAAAAAVTEVSGLAADRPGGDTDGLTESDTASGAADPRSEPGNDRTENPEHATDSIFEVYPLADPSSTHSPLTDFGEEEYAPRVTGRIHYLRDGFGFITPDSGEENIYFFHADVRNAAFPDLTVNDQVEYTPGENFRGPAALDIVVLK